MKNIEKRIEKIEKEINVEDNTQWLGLPDPDRPGEFIEMVGYRNLAELVIYLANRERVKSDKENV